MKKIVFIILLLFQLFSPLSQEKKELSIFKNIKNWDKEIIEFPIDWAPNLKVSGFEELLFTPSWKNPKSEQFWSLIIGWNITAETELTLKEIENNFKNYFDGLMKPNHWAKEFPKPEVTFSKNSDKTFTGKMKLFDGFYTGKIIEINIQLEQFFCEKQQKSILIFRLSPKKYHHEIWEILNEIQLKKSICNSIKNDEK